MMASMTPEASILAAPTDTSSNAASLSSTPPTTIADSISLASEPAKPESTPPIQDAIIAVPLLPVSRSASAEPSEPATPGRSRRARAQQPVYNLAKLSGTDIHGKRRTKGDIISERRRRTHSGVGGLTPTKAIAASGSPADTPMRDSVDDSSLQMSTRSLNTPRTMRNSQNKRKAPAASPVRRPTRSSGIMNETITAKLSTLGKRSRKAFEKNVGGISRELRRLQDTNEFAHIDERPVRYTVWSNGKYVDPAELKAEKEPPRKKAKTVEVEEEEEEAETAAAEQEQEVAPKLIAPRFKKWENKGLWSGQAEQVLSQMEKKALAQIPELAKPSPANKSLPMPMYKGLRLLIQGRDFKLPFDICHPAMRGQPKPEEWKKLTKSNALSKIIAGHC
jgi:[histone H3]-lysine4 N-trimethyltransferase ASH1L